MAVRLTMPVSEAEAAAYRLAGHWADDVLVDVSMLAALGERTALVDRRGSWTYAELAAATEELAAAMHGLGVRSGDAVAVVSGNDRESVAAYHAIGCLGAVAVMVHKASGESDVRFACAASAPALVLLAPGTDALRPAAADGDRAVRTIADLLVAGGPRGRAERRGRGPSGPPAKQARAGSMPKSGRLSAHALRPPSVAIAGDAPRLVVFTSGTTSTPKGVVHTTNTLRACAANYRAMTDLTSDDRFFLISPLASIAGVLQALYLAPALGAAAVLEDAFSDAGTLDLLIEAGGTFYGGTDVVLGRVLAEAHRRGVGVPLRAAAVGGTMLRHDLLLEAESTFGIVVLRVYGSSEVPSSTSAHPSEGRQVRLADDGRPAPGVELRIVDDASRELLVRGPHRFRGYLDGADNQGAFDGDWYRTGDAAEVVGGRLRVVGRLKEIASRSGKKVSLAEVEQAFAAATEIDGCAAFSVPDDVTGERVALAVRVPDGEIVDVPAALEAMVASGLAKWKLPESVVRYEVPFPVTSTGKVLRRELSEAHGSLLWRADRLSWRPVLRP